MGTHSFIKSRLTSPIMSIMPITKNRITQNRNMNGIAHNMILPNADILLFRIRTPKISKIPPKTKNSSMLQNVIANRIQHGETMWARSRPKLQLMAWINKNTIRRSAPITICSPHSTYLTGFKV